MKRSHAILKAAAVGCSVLLAAGFVSYRAGAFDWLNPQAPEPTPVVDAPNPATAPAEVTPELVPSAVLSSSKSAIILTPAASGSTSSPQPVMGSSKYLTPLIPAAPEKPAPPSASSPAPDK